MGEWVAQTRNLDWRAEPASPHAYTFHQALPGYEQTPLVELPQLAAEFGVARVCAKDESSRLGLPAFKALGASWAISCVLAGREEPTVIVTATDGNHGRAVAKFAREFGQRAQIFIPDGVSAVAVQAIRDEGADVTECGGSYDDAVAAAATFAAENEALLVQDTAWEGYEEIPKWIVEGYSTLFIESDAQLGAPPDLVVVPAGVGSLLQAALDHYRSEESDTAVISAEPLVAACMGPSLEAGRPVSVETGVTMMAGLNCGTPSSLAWPSILHGLDAAVAVSEEADLQAAHDLARLGVAAGPCGAAGLAAARVALGNADRRAHLGIDEHSVVLLIITEGAAANPLPAAS